MTIDYESFARASTLMHIFQGAALFLFGTAEIYALDNLSGKAALAGPLALLAAAAAMPLTMLALPGGWDPDLLLAALGARKGFYLFVAFACLFGAAGLSRLTQVSLGRETGGWQAAFLVFLAAAGVLYFTVAWRVNEEAWRRVLVLHSAIGATLLLAVAVKTVHLFAGRRALHVGWAVLLMITGLQLVTYKESSEAFSLHMVSISSAPELPPANLKAGRKAGSPENAGTADKERARN